MSVFKFAVVALALLGISACVVRTEPVRVREPAAIVVVP